MKGVSIQAGDYGLGAVITAPWRSEMLDYLAANSVCALELNTAKGWQRDDLSYLRDLVQLKSFTIIGLAIDSVEPIHFLINLRQLTVSTYCKTQIGFESFPQLEECALEWRAGSESLFDCVTLKKLFVNRYPGNFSEPFGRLVNLRSLAMLNSPIAELRGLGRLHKLRVLRLANLQALNSLAGIEGLTQLEELRIQTCRKIGAIAELVALQSLNYLQLDNIDSIDSLKPLEGLCGLRSVVFTESTNIRDGDLTPLARNTTLERIAFQNRRHYSHRREDFGKAYFG